MKQLTGHLLLAATLLAGVVHSSQAQAASSLDAARVDLYNGRADDALRKLWDASHQMPQNGEIYNLLCRTYLAEEHWDEAVGSCEKAVQLSPGNSEFHLWLGRAYGEKADRVSFVNAYSLGKKARAEFETAVHANGRNTEALSDLGEFYADAPGIVGGGKDKAEEIARRLDGLDQARAHELRARIAEAQKDYGAAENEFKAAISSAAKPANYWMTLGSFYRRRQRWDDMVAAIRTGLAADHEHTTALANGAWVLMRAKREPQLAIQMFETYLASSHKTDEAPAFVIHVSIGKLKKQLGDAAGAQKNFQAASALASGYKPASDATNTGR